MQHRRELFSRQKTVKDINEDSGLSSRDLPSVESDSCMKSAQEENLGEQVRKMCIQSDKPSFSTSTPIANRRPSFSLPRIFAQKKHDASVATAAATTVTLADEQPQLSPGTTTTTTTSAYNTGVDTGQESPPANTKKQCSTTVNSVRSTMLDGRNTVGTKTTPTTASVHAGVQQHPSMLPTLPRTKQLSRKQHVRFQSDSVSFLPPAVFYTSAERLAETIATQQRLLHQELSINELPQKQQQQQQQMGQECPISSRQQNWQNIAKCQTEHLNKKVPLPPPPNNQHIVVQYPRIQPPRQQLVKDAYASLRQQKAQQQYTSDTVQRANSQSQILQYSKDTAMLRTHSSNEAAKGQQVQHVQAYQQQQYPHDDIQQRVKVQQNVLHYPKEATTLRYHSSNAPAKGQQVQHEAQTNPQTGSLRRQQKPPKQQQQQLKVGKVQSLSYQQTQLQYAMSGVHSTTLPYPSDTTKSATLHRTEKRMTAAGDALSIGQELRHQQQHHPAAEANVSSLPTTTGFLNRRNCSANLAQNLPRSDWPRGAELAELFAFRPTAAPSAFGHNKQQHQREKRRGSPSKQISGQHRQQPELEWVIKRRSDGTRYVTRRPARKRTPSILAAVKARREQSLARERAGMSTTDDDGGSEAIANAGVALLKWWGQQHSSRRKPPPIPSAFSPSSLARKKPLPAAGGGVIRTDQSDPQKAFTITTV